MTDYGQAIRFGVFPAPEVEGVGDVLRIAAIADVGELDLIGIQDHPYQNLYLDAWMLLATILAKTERIAVFPDVANLPLRPPSVMAKAAASLDLISGGRFELGLGAGAFWEAINAMGGPRRSASEAVDALEEAINVIRLMWSGEPSVSYEGTHYRLAGAKPGPAPAHDMGIWLGVGRDRTLELTGRAADGWLPASAWAPPEKLPELNARIDDAAAAAGREASAVRRIYNTFGLINDLAIEGFLRGPVEQWVDELTTLALEHGMDTFIFGPATDAVRQTQRFAAEVAPAVREEVARARA